MMSLEQLQVFWFVLLGLLLAGYACLDGFDLGVGILHLFHQDRRDRRIAMNSIGPFWDGNEVWLVTFGGALFAVFPAAYAAAFSGFFLAFMFLLFALILRGVALEFRDKRPSRAWRACWDFVFFAASAVATFLFGVAVGNMFHGLPIGKDGFAVVPFWSLLNPYAIAVGLLAVATFAMHGAIFLYMKFTGDTQQRVHRLMWSSFAMFLLIYMLTTIATLQFIPAATRNFVHYPWAGGIVVVNVLAIANIPRSIVLGRPFRTFLSSCVNISCLICLFGIALFPNLVTSTIEPAYSLTIYNASSSLKTLRITQLIALLGMPFVLTYTASVYWVFRGKIAARDYGPAASHDSAPQ